MKDPRLLFFYLFIALDIDNLFDISFSLELQTVQLLGRKAAVVTKRWAAMRGRHYK